MSTINVNGIEINYRVEGRGPWITLSHSLTCDLSMWDDLAAALAPDFTVLRYDTRGHGQTTAPAGAYSFEQLTVDLIGLLDALNIERTHYLGLSIGGMIGQHFALAAPQRVNKLIIANSTSRIPPEAGALWDQRIALAQAEGCAGVVEGTLARWFSPAFRAASPAAVARIATQIRNSPVAGYIGCAAAIRVLDITAKISAISAPTLVIAGGEDPGTPQAMSDAIANAIPGAQLAVIPFASHLSCIEQPETFLRLVTDFLKG